MNEEKINLIRQKCTEANPEIGELKVFECPTGEHEETYHYRPIRLADVLLAMLENSFEEQMVYDGLLIKFKTRWNLRADDLTKQRPETIDFLYELLQ